MNNQNEFNENMTLTENQADSLTLSSSMETESPHDFNRVQELVNQLESKIQQINSNFSSNIMEKVYQKSTQDGSMKQVVEGEVYVGKNPTLAKFVGNARREMVETMKDRYFRSTSGNDKKEEESSNINMAPMNQEQLEESIPSLELTSPIPLKQNVVPNSVPLEISQPPLKPENIFDDEMEEEPVEVFGTQNSNPENLSEIYQDRGKAV